MASIPLPVLDLKPVQQPDIMENYGRLLQLQNMAQTAPLQRQLMQQQVQSGQLENQQKQIQLKDQQGLSAAMQEWAAPKQSAPPSSMPQGMTGGPPAPTATMPDYDSLLDLARKKGVSFSAYQGLQKSILDMKEKAATIAKDDAQTGSDNATALKTKNGLLTDAMTGVMSLPDDQIVAGLLSAAQDLGQKGLLDPQHVQMAQQLAQSGGPATIRKTLGVQIAGMGGFSKMLDEATKKTELQNKQNEAAFYAQSGGAPGVPTELMQQADWLKKNPGKGPSDYKLWTLRNSPTAVVMNNQLGGAQNQDALDFAAQNYRQTGQMPAGYTRSPATTTAIIQRAAALDQQSGGQGIAVNKSFLEANRKSLDNVQKQFDTVNAFESTATKNIDMALSKAEAIPDLGTRFANVPIRMLNEKMLGTKEMAEFRTALATAQAESAKVLNSANASGILSDSARKELEDITSGNLPLSAMKGQWNVIKQDMQNRHDSYQQQISDIQGRIKGASGAQAAPSAPSGPTAGTVENGYRFKGGDPGKQANWEKVQ